MKSSEYIELEERYGAHNYHPLDVVLARGEGVWVKDVDGNRYLDCLSAYSALNQGHVHPRILKAMQEQASQITLTSRAFRNDQLPLFYQELSDLTGYEMSLPMNSGAEAVETAIKLARKWAYQVKGVPRYQAEIIVSAAISMAVRSARSPSRPSRFTGTILDRSHLALETVPFGDAQAAAAAITPHTAAVLVEPIQGEAGVIIPPEGYFEKLRQICDDAMSS